MSGWLTPFDGSGIEWHESLPSPYTYQESDFSKLVAAVHEYESRLREAERVIALCAADTTAADLAQDVEFLSDQVAAPPCWHVICGDGLLSLLRRAAGGEDPEMLYLTEYLNAEREQVDGDE